MSSRTICEALGFDPTNHHNALRCPYCMPERQAPMGAAHLTSAIERLTKVLSGDEIEVAYANFTFPGHTFRADLRAYMAVYGPTEGSEP